MGRFIHDQSLTITATGAVDTGSGVVEYILYALRATVKGAAAPSDSQGNFDSAIEIGRLGNLAETQGYSAYDPANTYDYKWYNWEDGFAYRIWTMAVDQAGNIEIYDGSGNTYGTVVLLDSRPPQFIASYGGTRIQNNCVRKSDIQPWNSTKSASSLYFLITIDNGEYPEWFTSPGTDNLANYWLVFNSAASSPTYTYFAQIQANDNNGGVQDRVQIYCSATNPVYQLNNSTGEIVLKTAIASVVDNGAVEWASGAVVVLSRPTLTCGIGTMTVEYEGVDSSVADLDHYKIERYVINDNAPTYIPGDPTNDDYEFVTLVNIEDTKYIDYNLVWDKLLVINWVNGSSQYSDEKVYGRGLYKITPVDVFGNEGYPTLTFDYTNVKGFFPVTGTPPADITNKLAESEVGDDGNIVLEWDEPTDDDLRGYQIARRRGVYDGSGDEDQTSNYVFDSWELITEQDNDEFVAGGTYAKKYRDVNLEPFSTDLRKDLDGNLIRVAYQYRIRATDYSGNTSIEWVDLPTSTTIVKAVDTSVDTAGSGLTATPKIGSISLAVTQPTDNLSTKVHLYRSVGDSSSYESTPFKVVELAASGALSTQDEYPPVDAETLIYYKQKFEDQWGNVSGFVNETSATSKTAATAGDANPPYSPTDIDVTWRPEMPGTVSGVLGNTYLTYTPDAGEDPADYLSENNQFDVVDCYGDGETQRFTISSISGNTLNIDETLTDTVTTKQVVYDITGVATINFTKPSDKALAGTVQITSGTPDVVGTGTAFLTDFQDGERIKFLGTSGDPPTDPSYSITTVTDNENIILSENVSQDNASGLSYRGSVDYAGAILFKRELFDADSGDSGYIPDSSVNTTYTSTRVTDASAWDLSNALVGDIVFAGTSYGVITVVSDGSDYVDVSSWIGGTPSSGAVATIYTCGETVVVRTLASSQVSVVNDVNTIIGYWRYALTAYDTFNNESFLAWQTKVNGSDLDYVTVDDTLAPLAPEGIKASGGFGRVRFQWSRPGAPDVDHYKVLVKNQADGTPAGVEASGYDNVYSESLTIYNLTNTRDSIAKRIGEATNYWKVQVIVYDINGNSSESTWRILDERTVGGGATEQNAYLEDYQPASGVAPSSVSELLAVIDDQISGLLVVGRVYQITTYNSSDNFTNVGAASNASGVIFTATGTTPTTWTNSSVLSKVFNGKDADILLSFDFSGISDVDEIEKVILQRERQGDSSWSTVVEIATQSNSFSAAPGTYHDTNLLNETGTGSSSTETFKYRLVAVSFGGMITVGTASSAVNCTDITGQDISGGTIAGNPNVGSVQVVWQDVIDKNSAIYEIYRSPNNLWTTVGTTCEKIATVPSSRADNTETLYYNDNDWDNITGKIPDDKTELADGSYDGRVAYYRIVGVDHFGNFYAISGSEHLTTGALSSQYYAPAIPIGDDCVALFPFSDGIVSTRGHVPKNTNIPQCYLRNDGKFGGGCMSFKTAPEDILEYANQLLVDGNMEEGNILNWTPAMSGQFNGTDDFVNLDLLAAELVNTNNTKGTIIWRGKIHDATTNYTRLWSFGDTDVNEYLSMGVDALDNTLTVNCRVSGTDQWVFITDNTFSEDIELNIVLIQNGTEPVLYINGVLEPISFPITTDQTAWFNDLTGVDNGRIGCLNQDSGGDNSFLNQSVNFFSVFNRALDVTKALYYSKGLPTKPEDKWGSQTTITAGSFIVGDAYRIVTVGTTDFTLIGASSNTVGVEFTATGVGSGTGTANRIGVIGEWGFREGFGSKVHDLSINELHGTWGGTGSHWLASTAPVKSTDEFFNGSQSLKLALPTVSPFSFQEITGLAVDTDYLLDFWWKDPEGVLTELVIGNNSSFEAIGNWSPGSGATLTANYDSGDVGHDKVLRIESGGASDGALLTQASMVALAVSGNKYRLEFDYKYINAPAVNKDVDFAGVTVGTTDNTALTWTKFTGTFTASTSADLSILCGDDAADELLIDNVHLVEIHNTLSVAIEEGYGAELITNGNMELVTGWADYGSPSYNERWGKPYTGGYSRFFAVTGVDNGIKSNTFTTVTDKLYYHTVWIYPDDTTDVDILIRKGDDSGFVYDTTHSGLTQDAWNKIIVAYKETAGGSSAYLAISSGSNSSGDWYVDDASIKQVSEMNPTYIELTGNGNWQHEQLVFQTDSIATSVILRILPGIANVGEVYFDYAFCVVGLVVNGGMIEWSADDLDDWTESNADASEDSGAKITTSAAYGYIESNAFAVTSGRSYIVFWKSKATAGDSWKATIRIQAGTGLSGAELIGADTSYIKNAILFNAIATENYTLQLQGVGNGDIVWFDEVQIVELITTFNEDDIPLKYDSTLVPVTGFTLDMYVRHGWDSEDNLEHYILDADGESDTQNRVFFRKSSDNKLLFRIYGDTASGYREVEYVVTESNFVKDVFHRIVLTFDPDLNTLKLYLNGDSVGSASSGGTWVDPTQWGTLLYVGGKNDNVPGDIHICQLTIFDEIKEPVVIQTFFDVDRNFFDGRGIRGVPGIANVTANHTTSDVSEGVSTELPPASVF